MNIDTIWTIAVVFLALASIGSALAVYGCCAVAAKVEGGNNDDHSDHNPDPVAPAVPAELAT